jgi:lipid-A-disaccharide synthase-like uncharacterized protein
MSRRCGTIHGGEGIKTFTSLFTFQYVHSDNVNNEVQPFQREIAKEKEKVPKFFEEMSLLGQKFHGAVLLNKMLPQLCVIFVICVK